MPRQIKKYKEIPYSDKLIEDYLKINPHFKHLIKISSSKYISNVLALKKSPQSFIKQIWHFIFCLLCKNGDVILISSKL